MKVEGKFFQFFFLDLTFSNAFTDSLLTICIAGFI